MTFILADACVVTVNGVRDILDRASVLVRGDRIAEIGSAATLKAKAPEADVIDCAGNILMPGMVNTHTHLFQTLLKGPGDDMVLKKWFTCMTGPAAVELTVTETEPGIQGDRVSGARKPATLQTGHVVQVPLFVNIGDVIKVDTRSGEYLTRA